MDDGWMPESELPLQAWLAFFRNRYGWFLAVYEHVRHAFPCDLLNAVQCLVRCFVQPAEVGEFEYGSYPFLVFVRPFDFVCVAVGGVSHFFSFCRVFPMVVLPHAEEKLACF